MKRKKLLTLIGSLCLILALVAIPLAACTPEPTPTPTPEPTPTPTAEPIVLKAAYIWGKQWESNTPYFKWVDMVNKRGKGLIQIEFIGGPEIMPSLEALDFLRKGAVDVINTSMAYHGGIVPEGQALSLWYGPTSIEREAGLLDLLDEIYRKKVGITVLGRAQVGSSACLWSSKRVSGPDLTGLKFRSIPSYDPVIKALGATCTMIPAEEVYTALERGIVDGQGWSGHMGFKQARLHEVLHYRIGPYFGQTETAILMRAEQFDRLPPAAQELLLDTMKDAEDFIYYWTRDLYLERWKELARDQKVIEVLNFSPKEEEDFLEMAWNVKMEELIVKPSPEYGNRLKEILESIKDKQAEPPVR